MRKGNRYCVIFYSHFCLNGAGDLNRCDPVCPKCLETERHAPLPIGRFSSAEGGKSTRRRYRINVTGRTGRVSEHLCENVGVGLSDRFVTPVAQDPSS
jgi:hypothetical protein